MFRTALIANITIPICTLLLNHFHELKRPPCLHEQPGFWGPMLRTLSRIFAYNRRLARTAAKANSYPN